MNASEQVNAIFTPFFFASLTDRALPGVGVRENVPFDEQPFGILDALFVDMAVGKMAGNGQAGAHGAFGVRRDDADAGARGGADDGGVADIDAKLLEFVLIKQAVAIVADAADESAFAP
jgi:hypothetical protein